MFASYKTDQGSSMDELRIVEEAKQKALQIEETTLKGIGAIDTNGELLVALSLKGGTWTNTVGLYPEGFDYLCYRLGIPDSYLGRCPANLVAPHVNYWIGEVADRSIRVFIVDRSAIAFVTDRFAYIPNGEVLADVEKIPNVVTSRWTHSPAKMTVWLKADNRTPETVAELVPGEEATLGMMVSNSDTGWGQLACRGTIELSNGGWMVVPGPMGGFERRHQGNPKALWEEFKGVWDSLVTNFSKVADRLTIMAHETITPEEEEGVVGKIVELLGLPKKAIKELAAVSLPISTLGILERVLKLADNPDYAAHADKIRQAAGEWVVTENSTNPLWVTI